MNSTQYLVSGRLLVAVAALLMLTNWHWRSQLHPVRADVVGVEACYARGRAKAIYCLVDVRYPVSERQPVHRQIELQGRYKVGDPVEGHYHPIAPRDFRLHPMTSVAAPFLLALLGGIVWGGGLLLRREEDLAHFNAED